MVIIGEAIEPLAENFPDEQTAARLHFANVAGGVRIAPGIVADRLVAEFGPFIEGQAIIGAGKFSVLFKRDEFIIGVEDKLARGLGSILRVTRYAAPRENRFN